jgi:CRISPR-associated protein Cmr4
MFKLAKPFVIRTISPMHVGSGSDLGIVDLPIQREKHTGFPKIEASSLKGSLREALENIDDSKKQEILENQLKMFLEGGEINLEKFDNDINLLKNYFYALNLVFGFDEDGLSKEVIDKFENDKDFAGAIGFSDASVLLFPVKSVRGVFAWITSPSVLRKFAEQLRIAKAKIDIKTNFQISEDEAIVADRTFMGVNNNVILEEYSFIIKDDSSIDKLSEQLVELTGIDDIKKRLVILSDDSFKDFVNLSTEVITRTKIDNTTGTVSKGALFNEEYLPAETILFFLTFASPIFQKKENKGIFKNAKKEEEMVFEFFNESLPEVVQIGGNATLGKGIAEIYKIKV